VRQAQLNAAVDLDKNDGQAAEATTESGKWAVLVRPLPESDMRLWRKLAAWKYDTVPAHTWSATYRGIFFR